jgi:RHS repeat-associated protein
MNGHTDPTFTYDANGNMLAGAGRSYTWTSFNMPSRIEGSKHSSGASVALDYEYNDAHERVRLIHSTLGTITYLHPSGAGSLLYEKRVRTDGVTEHTHYISAGRRLIVYYMTYSDTTAPHFKYLHQDHQSSVATIIAGGGVVRERLAYEPFGKRREVTGADDPANALDSAYTDRGFTSHEHLDEVALIHMNGRVYDPVLARFLSADPIVQVPSYLPSYNRYGYAFNNPLAGIDPSGFSISSTLHDLEDDIESGFRSIVGTASTFPMVGSLMQAGLLVSPFFGVGYGWSTGDWTSVGQAYVTGAIVVASAYLFAWAGGPATVSTASGAAETLAAHAAAGCASAILGSGNCARGAAAAVAGRGVTLSFGAVSALTLEQGFIAAAAAGGTASVIGGGKFANGAVTASFGYLFGRAASPDEPTAPGGADRCLGCSGDIDPDGLMETKGGTKRIAPPPNDGKSPQHGSTPHDTAIRRGAAEARARGATDIRVNQLQVNLAGEVVGINRPDLQYNLGGKHWAIEYDTVGRKAFAHYMIIKFNDPAAEVRIQPVTGRR